VRGWRNNETELLNPEPISRVWTSNRRAYKTSLGRPLEARLAKEAI
jgi:hypothetical protein